MEKKVDGIYDGFKELGTGKMIVLGLQHVFAMFGATVLVPILTGLSISVTLFCAGIGTIWFSSDLPSHSSAHLHLLQTVSLLNFLMQRLVLSAPVFCMSSLRL